MKKRFLTLVVTLLACIMSANATLSSTDYVDNDYVGEWGRLKLVGNQLCAESGDTIQLRGASSFSVQYIEGVKCLTKDGFAALKKWGCNVVRLSIYPRSSAGEYNESVLGRVKTYIDYCVELGMYVIVDWDVHEFDFMEGNPLSYTKVATELFTNVSSYAKDKNYKNVIYEICDEPSTTWSNISKYCDSILPIIEKNDPGAIVIVGTPDNGRDFTDVLANPIQPESVKYNLGIMYSYHHSACDGGPYLSGLKTAAEKLPVFVSEWWVNDYDGAMAACYDKSDDFIALMADSTSQKISWVYWAFGEKKEVGHMMKQCIFDDDSEYLSEAGKYIIPKFGFVQKPVVKPYEYHPENYTLDSTNYADNNYVGKWGRLKLVGNQLCAESGDTIQLKGASSFSVQYIEGVKCLTKEGFAALKKWGCNVVRLSIYPRSSAGGYSESVLERVKTYIDNCVELNMYVIVDWDVHEYDFTEGDPLSYIKEATALFTGVSSYAKDKNYKNVIYEICDEPSTTWSHIFIYCDSILPIIEQNDPGAIVIVGTPDYSRDFTDVLANPIQPESVKYNLGIMYGYHHSACDGAPYLSGLKTAAEKLPVFVSEWWVNDYDGAMGACYDKSDDFIALMADSTSQKISWVYWAFGEKNEVGHMMKQCIFDDDNNYLSETGKYIIPKFGFEQKPSVKPYEYHPENYTLDSTNYTDNNYVGKWGRLKLVGNQLCAESGDTIQLKGVSTFSLGYKEVIKCLTLDGFKSLKKWGCSVVRLSQYPVYEYGKYDENALAKIKQFLDYCAELNMYVIADWHVFNLSEMDGNPLSLQKEAKGFFTDITSYAKEKGYMNIIYEICSEPSTSWSNILKYSDAVLPIIEKNDPGAIVIVGTPEFCTDFSDVLKEPVQTEDINYNLGIMYSYHHSVCSGDSLLPGLKDAAKKLPIFVSEWWPMLYDGEGAPCFEKADEFVEYLENGTSQKLSWTYWAFGEKNEPSHMMTQCIFDEDDKYVSEAGKYIIPKFGFVQKSSAVVPDPDTFAVDCEKTFPSVTYYLEDGYCSVEAEKVLVLLADSIQDAESGKWAMVTAVRDDGKALGELYEIGLTELTWEISPSSGSAIHCTQTIDVKDTIAPKANCSLFMPTVKIMAAEGDSMVPYEEVKLRVPTPEVEEDCGKVSVKTKINSNVVYITHFPIGISRISYLFTDAYGNKKECVQPIEVLKYESAVDCPKAFPNMSIKTDSCNVPFEAVTVGIDSLPTDPLTGETAVADTFRASGASMAEPFAVGSDTIIWHFKFQTSGRKESCHQIINVESTTTIGDLVNCSLIDSVVRLNIYSGDSIADLGVKMLSPCIEDKCSDRLICPTITRSDSLSLGDIIPIGKTIFFYTYADGKGNEVVCQQIVEVVEDIPLGANAADADNVVSVVPNPTNGQFSVVVAEPSLVSIYNAVGVKVYEIETEGTLSVSEKFVPGIYSVAVKTNNSVKTVKLIVTE